LQDEQRRKEIEEDHKSCPLSVVSCPLSICYWLLVICSLIEIGKVTAMHK